MLDIFFILIFVVILPLFVLFVGFGCLYENYLNPLPKFKNGDKSDNSIEFVKTRKIVK